MYKHLEIATKPNYFLKFELLQVRVCLNLTRNCSYLPLLKHVSYLFYYLFLWGWVGQKDYAGFGEDMRKNTTDLKSFHLHPM